MREILFKAKNLDNGKWVEGYYFTKPILNYHYILEGENQWQIDPNTLCQFTGLMDKNGNKIWENDIVDVSDCWWDATGPAGYDSPIVLVEWNKYNCGFDPFANYDCDCGVFYRPEEVKVIGNKFDNPKLLEE